VEPASGDVAGDDVLGYLRVDVLAVVRDAALAPAVRPTARSTLMVEQLVELFGESESQELLS